MTGLRDVPVPPEKIIMDKVVVNPKFYEALFSKPEAGLSATARETLSSGRCGEAKTDRFLSSILQTTFLSRM